MTKRLSYIIQPHHQRKNTNQDIERAIRLLNELLDIFCEMMDVYTNYSPIRWSKAIQNKDKLEKLFSAVFRKIANMRIRLSDAIASFRSHDFISLAEQHISRNIYASEKLMNHIDTFNNSNLCLILFGRFMMFVMKMHFQNHCFTTGTSNMIKDIRNL